MELVSDINLEELALKIIIDKPGAIVLFRPEFFSSPQTGIVYSRLSKILGNTQRLDKNLLTSALLQTNQLDMVGGDGFIEEIFSLEYDEDLIEEYANKLKELYARRLAQIRLHDVVKSANRLDLAELSEMIMSVQDVILQECGIEKDNENFKDLLDQELEYILSEDKGTERFFKTRFTDYDLLTGGIEKSNLEIIAARPSMGKTSLMLRWLLNLAKQGIPVDIVSLEMSRQQVSRRLLSMESQIPSHRLQHGAISPNEKEILIKTIDHLKTLPIHISYSYLSNSNDLYNYIRLSHKTKGIQVFGVDYIQQISVKPGMETTEFSRIASNLKSLAVELDISILLLSQLNRAVEQRKDKRPILSDLRQSGGLEENADKVIFIYRQHMYEPKEEYRNLAEIIVAKNRNGPTAPFNYMFDPERTNFYEL